MLDEIAHQIIRMASPSAITLASYVNTVYSLSRGGVPAQRPPTGNRPLSVCSLPRVRDAQGPVPLGVPATERRRAHWVLNPMAP